MPSCPVSSIPWSRCDKHELVPQAVGPGCSGSWGPSLLSSTRILSHCNNQVPTSLTSNIRVGDCVHETQWAQQASSEASFWLLAKL